MEKLDVIFKLDPVNDGLVFKKTGIKRKDKGALIIATNGDSRIADPDEAQEILEDLDEKGQGEYIGKSPYLAMLNRDKILSVGYAKCFVGTAIIMKYDGKGGLAMLSGDEFDEAARQFESRLITLTGDGQEFSAYEVL